MVKNPSVLSNNYQQVVKMASSLEKRHNMMDQYNVCNVHAGVH